MGTPTSKMPEKVDSKFRFVLVAACRAEQLMKGARTHLEGPEGKKPTRVAQEEVRSDLVAWDYGAEIEPETAGGEDEALETPSAAADEDEEGVH